jgi:molybdopterin molybdotransferase
MALIGARWDEARAELAARVRPLPVESRPLARCDGLVLADDLIALCPLPTFDTSAMDGWAVRGPGPWAVVGESLAGRPSPRAVRSGQAVAIATGAMVPSGADAVIPSEEGEVHPGVAGPVLVSASAPGPIHIRPAGQECAAGEVLARAGTVLAPALLGLAAASGHDALPVVRRPRAALVLFGDELATEGIPPHGHVRDSLGPQVPAWLARMGAEVVVVWRGADTLAAHVDALGRASETADIVLTTGGTAAGPVDHLHAALAACDGEMVLDTVAVRPGHPMLVATLRSGPAWVVGLPGNPQSAIVALVSLGAPIISALAGRTPPHLADVVLADSLTAPADEDRLVLGTVAAGVFHAGTHLGSAMLRGLSAATGFAVIPPGGADQGATVRWLPLPL